MAGFQKSLQAFATHPLLGGCMPNPHRGVPHLHHTHVGIGSLHLGLGYIVDGRRQLIAAPQTGTGKHKVARLQIARFKVWGLMPAARCPKKNAHKHNNNTTCLNETLPHIPRALNRSSALSRCKAQMRFILSRKIRCAPMYSWVGVMGKSLL